MAGEYRDALAKALWPARALSTSGAWAILDGARDDRIFPLVRDSGLNQSCLYSGNLPRELRFAAPYLVELDPSNPATGHLLDLAWGDSWGVFLKVDDGSRLRHHLKGFLRVRTEGGKKLVFRFYDPRVLRAYLPTCTLSELRAFFGPIRSFVAEAESPETLIEFSCDGFRLTQRSVALGTVAAAGAPA
jgi:hypothetical protein